MTHTCNPSYLGGRDWEDQGSRPAQAKVCETLMLINSWEQWHVPVIQYHGKQN
jgi:hypothetical protein